MRAILGTTKDKRTKTMRFMPDLPPMHTRQKLTEWNRSKHTSVPKKNPHNPLHEAVKDTPVKLRRGKSWMGQAEEPMLPVCQLTELKQNKE